MIDIKELRRLAEAATPGEWKPMYSARKSNPSEKDKFYSVSALSPAIPGWCDAKNIDIATVCKIYDGTDASNSAYIAAANPSAILSLLDHIEQQEAEIARLHSSLAGAVQHGEQGWQRYESANRMSMNQQKELVAKNEEIARLRKDADRYKFLRDTSNDSYRSAPMVITNPIDREHSKLVYGEDLDNVIDYAIDKSRAPDTSTQEVG